MSVVANIYAIDTLIGMTILSRVSGNKLGQVSDLIIDPVKGTLLGLTINAPEGVAHVLDYNEIYSFGQDAVMANSDGAVVIATDDGPLAAQPRAKRDLAGAQIITEGGKLLGKVANVFVHLVPPPLAIYDVRESVLDRVLGRALFIPASAGRALSSDAERIIVPNNTAEIAADSLEVLAEREIAPLLEEEMVVRRDHADDLPQTS